MSRPLRIVSPAEAGVQAVLAAVLLLSACASKKPKKTEFGEPAILMIEGWAKSGAPESKAQALDDARREAVAVAVRTHLPASTLAAKPEPVDRMLSDPGRFIFGERIASEAVEGGFHKLKLEAGVLFERVGAELRAAGLLPPAGDGSMRIGLSLQGPGDAAAPLEKTLGERGFVVVRSTLPAPSTAAEAAPGAESGASARTQSTVQWAAAEAARLDVEAVAACESKVAELAGLEGREAKVECGSYSRSGEPAGRSEGRGLAHGGSEIAVGKALGAAAGSAAEDLAVKLSRRLAYSRPMAVKVMKLGTPQEVQRLLERLRALEGVSSATLEKYSESNALFSIRSTVKESEDLAALILRDPSFHFDVKSVLPRELELERR